MISAGIFKEDARAWLPMNVTTKIMMTFNGFTLAKFLHLRTAKGAQLEIRNMANEMVHQLFTSTEAYIDFIDTVLKFGYEDVKPRYTSDAIDEEIEIKTESFEDSKIDANEAERLLKVEEEYKNLEKN
jgi:thymidylate synthase ThyX